MHSKPNWNNSKELKKKPIKSSRPRNSLQHRDNWWILSLITEADSARRKVEALKIEAKVNDGDINQCNNAIPGKIEEADSHIENLEEWLENRKMEAEKQEREEKMQFEIKLHETKLKLQENLQIKAGNQKSSVETSVGEAESLSYQV